MALSYGPPISSSDSEYEDDFYDGFSFGDNSVNRKKRNLLQFHSKQNKSIESQLYEAVQDGNLDELKNILHKVEQSGNNFDVNKPCDELSMLHYACLNGNLEIVSYLINFKNADVNTEYQMETPLLCVCKTIKRDEEYELILNKIGELLKTKGAFINISNIYGMTPFLFACREGHLGLIKLIVKDVALDAADNTGNSAIFHAIEGNNLEVVQFLLDYGIDANIINSKGYTPNQVAELYGFHDIYKILPKEEIKYTVPSTYLSYNSVCDYIPRIFLKTDTPEFFQEIYIILSALQLSQYTEKFALASINLSQFLTINDKKLIDIGIKYQFERDRIRLGLLYFHINHWTVKSIKRMHTEEPDNFYDILMLSANHLKNLIIISSTIEYVQQNLQNSCFGELKINKMNELKCNIKNYRKTLNNLIKTIKYVCSFRPVNPPLFIDYNNYKVNIKKQNKVKLCFKYSLIIGLSIIVCITFKNRL